MKTKITLAIFFTASFFLQSCLKTNTCPYADLSITAGATEVNNLNTYLTANSITAVKHSNGFFYEVVQPGTGTSVQNLCSNVLVKYKGSLENGHVFDSTVTGSSSLFTLGTLIYGWQKGIPLIRKGGIIKLYIPPSLGYGSTDVKKSTGEIIIPANSNLIFSVELVDVAN